MSLFWGGIVPAKGSLDVEFPEAILTLTDACIPDPKGDGLCRLISNVQTVILNQEDDKEQEADKYEESTALVCTLIPGKQEHASINVVYSPINVVSLENQGESDIHVSGYLSIFDDEEEEEEEEFNEDDIAQIASEQLHLIAEEEEEQGESA